jgi:cob(I)alamin adenosyltransferase
MGLVHIYCGDGKGKTSAAVGLAVRAAGRGKKIVIARFLKTDDSGEVEILKNIPGITLLPCERTFGFFSSMDDETKREACGYYRELYKKAVSLSEHADMLVLDEIMAAVRYDMIPEEWVVCFLDGRPENLEVVMTGRDPADAFLERADYVSEIQKRKHPYDRGILARKGIEY